MRMMLYLLLLLILSPLTAFAAPQASLLRDRTDQINYAFGFDLGQKVQAEKLAFDPDTLWLALHDGLNGVPAKEGQGVSYRLGQALGQELVHHEIAFRGQALWQGLYDLIDNAQPQLSETEMTRLLTEIRGLPEVATSARTTPGAATAVQAPPPKIYRLPGEKFLAENKGGDGIVSLPSGLQYRILESGKGEKPTMKDSVLVSYVGKTIKGKVFSSSGPMGTRAPQTVAVRKVIPGWAQALKMMRVGDRWEIFLPARLAYKDAGPMAGQTVIYDLELLEVIPDFH